MLKTDPNERITTAQIVDGLNSGSQFVESSVPKDKVPTSVVTTDVVENIQCLGNAPTPPTTLQQ